MLTIHIDSGDLPLQRVYRWEKECGDRVYLTQPIGGGAALDLTWAQVADQARRLARHLQSYGFPPGARVAILAKNAAHFIVADLAIWMAGLCSVALYPTLQPETLAYILGHSDARLLFVGKLDGWERQAPAVPPGMPKIALPFAPADPALRSLDTILRTTEPLLTSPTRDPDDTALIAYTSGSTGKPKGVVHTFRSIASATRGVAEVLRVTADDRMLSYLPLAHIFERAAVELLSIRVGMRLFFVESQATFLADLQRARPTIFHSVPRLWLKFQQGVFAQVPPERLRALLRVPMLSHVIRRKILRGLGLDRARLALSGSAPIPPSLIQWYRDLGLELLEGYAMSENFAYSHLSLPGRSRVGYVGHPLPGVEVKLSPESEILVRSPGDMAGYFKDSELTRQSYTEDGFLRTGDRGELDEEGRLRITGRIKELFKTSKGKYVAPTPIENALNAEALVELSCVSGSGQPQPFALVLLAEELRRGLAEGTCERAPLDARLTRLLATVNEGLEPHERLAFLVVVADAWQIDDGLLTPTLKLRRDAIEARYAAAVAGWYAAGQAVIWEAEARI